MKKSSMYVLRGVLGLAATLPALAGSPAAQRIGAAPPLGAPTTLKAMPKYGGPEIDLSWVDNSRNELFFEVQRKEDGGKFRFLAFVPKNTKAYSDTTVDLITEYRYRVRAVNGAGSSAFSAVVRQNLKTLYPVPGSHELLHNWNETIGSAAIDELGVATGFHMGVDIQRLAAKENVVASVSGMVVQATNNTNGVVVIRYDDGSATPPLFQVNHLKNTLVATGDVVYAGQVVGEIATEHFDEDWVDHVHYVITNALYHALPFHPLGVFSALADRDPNQQRPALGDHAAAGVGPLLFQRQGAALGTYLTYDATHPLEGDIDLIVDFSDVMGTAPDQVPARLGYWIEQPPMSCVVSFNDVKTPASAYFLFDWTVAYFGDASGPLALSQAIMDYHQNFGGTLKVGGVQYPWENYKHFRLTNTKGSDGSAANVDAAQYWNTNAKDDGAAASSPHANYAGRVDTTKAREARFPDGTYTLHLIANDLIQDAGPFIELPMRLENFSPIVCHSDPCGGIVLPAGTDELGNAMVHFNEPMDTSVAAPSILSVNNGATITGAIWMGEQTIIYSLGNMQNGMGYEVRIKGGVAKDKPGTPGGRFLDGDEDGFPGGDHLCSFSIGI